MKFKNISTTKGIGMSNGHKPVRDGEFTRTTASHEHKSCWNCAYIRCGRMPNRWCAIIDDAHIYSGGQEDEIRDFGGEVGRKNGRTLADDCPYFKRDTTEDITSHEESLILLLRARHGST